VSFHVVFVGEHFGATLEAAPKPTTSKEIKEN